MPTDLLQSLLDALCSLDRTLAPEAFGARGQLAVVRSLLHEVGAHRTSPHALALASQAADELARLGRMVREDVLS